MGYHHLCVIICFPHADRRLEVNRERAVTYHASFQPFLLLFQRDSDKKAVKAHKNEARNDASRHPPCELFVNQRDKYSAFDDKGMPTHDAEGKQISKSQLKKLQKLYEAQVKRHTAFLKSRMVTEKSG
ncbi:uncharacterized protein DEA37_0005171 [Paragonimus westermani]|uniref:Uncharacterized protein n=1 Tax=Paragonimus westermani TaxID=34504 RepID=A0A5J4P0F5_9TREM|nr:uncharacterized protein DEA37_0005171 [Paragonimus westermani]